MYYWIFFVFLFVFFMQGSPKANEKLNYEELESIAVLLDEAHDYFESVENVKTHDVQTSIGKTNLSLKIALINNSLDEIYFSLIENMGLDSIFSRAAKLADSTSEEMELFLANINTFFAIKKFSCDRNRQLIAIIDGMNDNIWGMASVIENSLLVIEARDYRKLIDELSRRLTIHIETLCK